MDNKEFIDVFEKYSFTWEEEYGIHEIKFNKYNIEELSILLEEEEDISPILPFFEDTMYLDVWVCICNKKPNFFLKKIKEYQETLIKTVVNEMFYMNTQSINAFIENEENEFIFSGKKSVSFTREMKILLLIAAKIDKSLCTTICQLINNQLNHKLEKNNEIKNLWININVNDDGSINVNKLIFEKFKNFLLNNREYISEYKNDIVELYELLQITNNNDMKEIKEILFK